MQGPEQKVTLCDLTTFYSVVGGGVTSYLRQKAAVVEAYPALRLVRILPGERDRREEMGNVCTYWVKSRRVGFNPHYRYLLNYNKIMQILADERPQVLEVACPYWL